MLDINEAPDKTAATLEKFLENCEHEDPYIQNIWMAARHMVKAGFRPLRISDPVCKRHNPLDRCRLPSLDSSNTLPAKETRIVVTIHRGLLASVVSDVPIDITILKVDEDTDDTIYREESLEVDPDYVAQKFAEAEKFWEEEER